MSCHEFEERIIFRNFARFNSVQFFLPEQIPRILLTNSINLINIEIGKHTQHERERTMEGRECNERSEWMNYSKPHEKLVKL